jgi:type IV pilus assembly protein PilY1
MKARHAQPNPARAQKGARLIASALSLLLGLGLGNTRAATLNISDIPLDVLAGIPANIILTMDDSGSMAWGYMPDEIESHHNWHNAESSVYNKIYYDPNVTYLPAVDENGTSLGDSSFTNAWNNGFKQNGSKSNLSNSFDVVWNNGVVYSPNVAVSNVPAFYYVFDTNKTTSGGAPCDINNQAHIDERDSCYTKVVVSATSGPGGTDERTNFANWYSYYRLRHLLAKTAATRAFSQLGTSTRVAWQALNSSTTIGNTLPLAGSHRTDFFNWIYNVPYNGGTPLRVAFGKAGKKYSQTGANSAYREVPGDSNSPEYSCRQNFHFAFTDGYWNGSNTSNPSAGDYDDNDHTLNTNSPSNTKYGVTDYENNSSQQSDETPPFYRGSSNDYLADISLMYWLTDLRTDLTNNVPTFVSTSPIDIDGDGDIDDFDTYWNPDNDPADWQHMVSFTVGLGITGTLDPEDPATIAGLMDGSVTWPGGNSGERVDDLWHAAINSRGQYFSASNPQELVDGFAAVLQAIDERSGSASAVATTSSQYQAGTKLFQATYDSGRWDGDILAYTLATSIDPITGVETIVNVPAWGGQGASAIIAGQGSRTILTTNSASNAGVAFTWSDLSPAQQALLTSNQVQYLRGATSQELRNGGSFRNRTNLLGDIVHSDPQYIPPPGPPLFFYPDNLETVSYSTFKTTYASRVNMLVFGGNDGMMHILNADTGQELLGYVPSILFDKLSALTNPGYTHQFYVDQPVSVTDVFYNSGWHTLAVGGLGKGGQGLYALDITNPAAFTEANAANIVRWEFTDDDLGYTYTKPRVIKMNNDKWMVAFGNGYNSTEADGSASSSGDAILYLIDAEKGGQGTGSVLKKLSTRTGMAEDPLCAPSCSPGQGRANRLTDVVAVDKNLDFKADILYAGDLFGNLWKFDVSSSNTNQWKVLDTNNNPDPLFTATDASGNAQPITVAPAVQYHTKKSGYIVYVATGKYVEGTDPSDLSMQSVYGVWDREENNITTLSRAYLLEQQILETDTGTFTDTNARNTTNNAMNWYSGSGVPTGSPISQYLGWYMDLVNQLPTPVVPRGERVIDDLYVSGDRLEFITLIPSTNPCVGGGESWIFAINAITGSKFPNTPWDYNLDQNYDSLDLMNTTSGTKSVGSGIQLKTPLSFKRTKLLQPGTTCQEVNILTNSDGSLGTVTGSCVDNEYGRRSWRRIHIR